MSEAYDLYGADVSYFTGKLEAYMRYKGIPYRRIEARTSVTRKVIVPNAGIGKMPVLHAPSGEWLQDTTPIIDWLEARHPDGAVIPHDPEQAFFCRLLEDYADEWLWRPALHYRWSYRPDARHLGQRIARELIEAPLPESLRARMVAWRQWWTYVRGDGVDAETRAHVEGVYLDNLRRLEDILARHPFLLGERPSLADFGFFASMFRHFSLDPTPARIMRDTAPRVFAWVARLWAARWQEVKGDWPVAGAIPDDWGPILDDVGTAYLPYLHANAVAFSERRRRFDWWVQGVSYRNTPVVHYRVWCRERLQQHFEALPEAARPRVRARLETHGCWGPLWRDGTIASRLHEGSEPPVCRRPDPQKRKRLARAGSTAWNLPGTFDR
ncbi:MAG: glutathione S-transferase family protein [Myxococcota bacterium]|nr:glutathione S-transferase family protein [Myxococcota bacterium]